MSRRSVLSRVIAGAGIGTAGLATLGVLAAAGTAAWVARVVITPPKHRTEDIRVLGYRDRTITLSATDDMRLPGRYSFWFNGARGHLRLGEILSQTPGMVTRELLGVDLGDLADAERGYLGGWIYLSPDDLDVEYESVSIPTPVGPAPAWLIPADAASSRWAIIVHGRGVRRAEGLRAVESFRAAGYTTLLVSYRNDGDAPSSSDGRYALGDTEWQDVDAAIVWAIDRGASDVVLMGWSMGGATVLQAATRSSHAATIRGLVLESPVIDWVATLDYQGGERGLPGPIRRAVYRLLSARLGHWVTGQSQPIDLSRLDFVRRADELQLPILLLHSADDGFVPVTASRALAEARPDIVTYEEFTVARHTKLWNYDAARWNGAITAWLNRLREPIAHTGRSRRR
jgi:alpha-beta hydrolase superfamily lysophospholipase